MGFISLMVADAAISGILFALVIAVLAAAVFALAGLIVTIVFATGTKKRHAAGRTLGGKLAIPIVLFSLSAIIIGGIFGAYELSEAAYEPTQVRTDMRRCVSNDDVAGLDALRVQHPEIGIDDDGDADRWTLLQMAARCDEPDMVTYLLAEGADPNAGNSDDGGDESNVPLMLAVDWQTYGPFAEEDVGIYSGHDGYDPEVVEPLLDAGADPNPTTVYRMGASPLQLLCTAMFGNGLDGRDVETVQAMIDHGASLTYRDGNGKRAIDIFESNLTADWTQEELANSDPVVIEELRTLLTPPDDDGGTSSTDTPSTEEFTK